LTARQLGAPVVYAVLNDGRYGMVDNGFQNAYGRSRGFPLDPLDVPQFASSLGAQAITIRASGEIGALDWASLLHGICPIVLNIQTGPMSFGVFKDRIVSPVTGALS
jgi:thiamine pyrophosphate-dependent acetolactate synthase large subunit-like protein